MKKKRTYKQLMNEVFDIKEGLPDKDKAVIEDLMSRYNILITKYNENSEYTKEYFEDFKSFDKIVKLRDDEIESLKEKIKELRNSCMRKDEAILELNKTISNLRQGRLDNCNRQYTEEERNLILYSSLPVYKIANLLKRNEASIRTEASRLKKERKEMKESLINRNKSNNEVKGNKQTKYNQILEILKGKELTAREVESQMLNRGYSIYFDMNHVRPRLTELEKMGFIKEVRTTKDKTTNKSVTVYAINNKSKGDLGYSLDAV